MPDDREEREFRGGPRDGERTTVARGIGFVETPTWSREPDGARRIAVSLYRCETAPDGALVLRYVEPFHAAEEPDA